MVRGACRMSSPLTSSSQARALRLLVSAWARQPFAFARLMGCVLLATLFDLALPAATGLLINAVTQSSVDAASRAAAWSAFGVFTVVVLGAYLSRLFGVMVVPHAYPRAMGELVTASYGRVQRFSAQWHADTFAGKTVREVARGMWAFDTLTDTLTWGLGPTTVMLVGMTIYLTVVWPWVGLFTALMLVGFFAAIYVGYVKRAGPINEASNARDSAIGAALADAVGGNAAVRAFGAEAREDARFARVVRRWRKMTTWAWSRFIQAWMVQSFFLLALQVGMAGLLVAAWTRGEASAGDVGMAIAAFLLLSGYLRQFGEEAQNLRKGLDEMADMAAFAHTEPEVADAPGAKPFAPRAGAVSFQQVRFRYAADDALLYDDFNLDIAPGETVALVGATGSGKSTFVKLLQRLYDVEAGAIRVDDQDVRDVTQASLRRHIALVPQDPILFHRSLAENIAYAQPDARQDEIERAARHASAHDFISALPNGYRTMVGERGVKLSGGERQRVALARAFLADAPILVLDEATSSLDAETERQIQAGMERLARGRTTIIIAHRLSTVRSADRILVFDKGRVVEEGAHASLMARADGAYRKLVAGQAVLEDS